MNCDDLIYYIYSTKGEVGVFAAYTFKHAFEFYEVWSHKTARNVASDGT